MKFRKIVSDHGYGYVLEKYHHDIPAREAAKYNDELARQNAAGQQVEEAEEVTMCEEGQCNEEV